ncbi:MAG: arylamine N-acetyltransferase [Cyclobacteriaceae bacterium]
MGKSNWKQKIPEIDVERYLQRIGFTEPSLPNYDYLKKLHKLHQLNIPFENLDIHWQKEIILEYDPIYEKIVANRRGGFCYELNGLFHALLLNLGFKADLISVRMFKEDGEETPEYEHMAILVEIDDTTYLADVGYGDLFLEPKVLIPNELQIDYTRYYKFTKSPDDDFILWQSSDASSFERKYIFSTQRRQFIEFVPRCHWQQTSPDSHFTNKKICTIATQEGRISLSDGKLIETVKGKKKETHLLNADDFNVKLKERFGFDF